MCGSYINTFVKKSIWQSFKPFICGALLIYYWKPSSLKTNTMKVYHICISSEISFWFKYHKRNIITFFSDITLKFPDSLHKKWSFPLRIFSINVTKKNGLKKPVMENFLFLCSDFDVSYLDVFPLLFQ